MSENWVTKEVINLRIQTIDRKTCEKIVEEDAGYIYDLEEGHGSYDRVLQITYEGSKAAYVRVLVDAAWA